MQTSKIDKFGWRGAGEKEKEGSESALGIYSC
jgi:hypothetical protein